jgi:hypothetical protein
MSPELLTEFRGAFFVNPKHSNGSMRPLNQKRPRGGRLGGGGRRHHPMGGGNRNYDSSGPDIKIRGSANHIFDRYCQLARDANAVGDRIAAENYLQHAEHYYRILLANGMQAQRNGGNQPAVSGNGAQPPQPHQGGDPSPSPGSASEVDADADTDEAPI